MVPTVFLGAERERVGTVVRAWQAILYDKQSSLHTWQTVMYDGNNATAAQTGYLTSQKQ